MRMFNTISPIDGKIVNTYIETNFKKIIFKKDKIEFDNLISYIILKLKKDSKKILENTCKETGLPIKYLIQELEDSIKALKYLKKQSSWLLKEHKIYVPKYTKQGFLYKMPKGIVLQILPFSTPLLSNILLPFSACIAGNKVIAKPSSKSPFIGSYLQEIFDKKGFHSIKFLIVKGIDFLNKVIDKVDFVFYMGNEIHGRILETKCINKRKEFLGEYNGNDWAIILSGDTKIISKKIIQNAVHKSGQDCDAIKGILIENSLFDKFKKNIIKEAKKIKIGNPLNKNTDVGPLFDSKSCKNMRSLLNKLSKKEKLFGGSYLKENVYEPLIIQNNSKEKFIKSSLFAPVLWIKSVSSEEEILNLLKKNPYGLSVCIYSKNIKKAKQLAKKINAARVIINSDTLDIHPLIPWGGVKKTSKGGADYWVSKYINNKLIEIV